jgi:hypothetical protein
VRRCRRLRRNVRRAGWRSNLPEVAEDADVAVADALPGVDELLPRLLGEFLGMGKSRGRSVQLAGLDLLAVFMGHHVMLHPRDEVFLGFFLQGRGDVYFIAD